MHVVGGLLHIQVVQQTGQPPALLIAAQALGQSSHDGFGGPHVTDQVLVLNLIPYEL